MIEPMVEGEYYVLSDDDEYFTADNLFWGKKGEECSNQAIRYAFPEWTVKHNTWGKQYEYACSHGIDITAIFEGYIPIVCEVKNLKNQNKPYGTDWVVKKVLPRFYHLGTVIKVLIITFMHLLTKKALALLEQENIIVISTEERMTTEFKLSSRIHAFASKLSHLIHPQKIAPVQYKPIISSNPNTSSVSSSMIEQQYTTPPMQDRGKYLDGIVVRPHIVVNHPCNVNDPNHERWMQRQLERLEKCGQ